MKPSDLHDTLQEAATVAHLLHSSFTAQCNKVEALERELAARPTEWAYQQACKALWHWRDEAARLAKIAGVEPRRLPTDRN